MEITEQNYELYRKYLNAMYGKGFYNKKEQAFFAKIVIGGMISFIIPAMAMMIGDFFNIILTIIMTAGISVMAFSREIMHAKIKSDIKKDNPDFDTSINLDELSSALSKFEEKSNNPVAMDNRAETSIKNLRYLDEKIDTPEEILNTLKTEKEFWEKVVESEKEKEVVKSKKMC